MPLACYGPVVRFWPIVALVIALNAGVATLILLGSDEPAPQMPPTKATSIMSTRTMAPAKGDSYNYRQMAIGGAVVVVAAGVLVWLVRRQGRDPMPTAD